MSELMKDSDVVSGFLKMLMCANSGDIKVGAVGDLLEI